MPTQTRQSTPAGEPERLVLETDAGDDTYQYTVELREHPTDATDGTAAVVDRRRFDSTGVEELDPSATDAIRDHLAEQGYTVETAE